MPSVTVATFNAENLFARFKFENNVDPDDATANGFTINDLAFDFLSEEEKTITARAIREIDADIIALQEIENLDVLKRFRNRHLKAMAYTHAILIDGNDPRQIDVAVLSRHPIIAARSYQHLKEGNQPVLSRDCLEVDIEVEGKRLVLFVNHFKSMLDKDDPANGRKNTRTKRVLQSKTVKGIVTSRFGAAGGQHPWIVLGDFNDYLAADQGTTSGIKDLVEWDQIENVLDRLPLNERWTHFFAKRKDYHQLDYILLSQSLAAATAEPPKVERRGLSTKATKVTEARFPDVTDTAVASDHCPQSIKVNL